MRAILGIIVMLLNLLPMPILVTLTGLFSKLLPFPIWKKFWLYLAEKVFYPIWIDINYFALRLATSTNIIVQGNGELDKKDWYCLMSNHQSWLDILLLQKIFNRKIPALKFFMKQSLMWKLPLAGLGCWAIDFPFMKRYKKSYLKRHPEKKGKDRELTRQACLIYEKRPTAVTSFLESTRFTVEKKAQQVSPFRHLLRPQATTLAFVLYALQDSLHRIIDITIIYPKDRAGFWNFLFGKMDKVVICYDVFPITKELRGNYFEDRQYRKSFQAWLNQKWENKDKLIETWQNK